VTSTTDAKDVSILAALADPIRLAIVKRLSRVQETTGVELAKRLGISRALLCHHAGILVSAGVTTRRKAGQTGYLRLNAIRLRRCIEKLGVQTPPRKRRARPSRIGRRPVRSK
jgi:DNA-binding transcriptional ArsR family regulator